MVEITVTQYEKHQKTDTVLDYTQCSNEINAANWVKDSWDYELDGIVNKSLSIKFLIKKITRNKIVAIKSPYMSGIQIIWTICKH